MKTVVFHIGSGKTGSSAIQSGLARYSSELLQKGILYPDSADSKEAKMGKVTSGNGGELLKYLSPKYRTKNFDENLFIESFTKILKGSESELIVFSNEQLELGTKENWKNIFTIIKSFDMDVKVIYYARNLVDHACSVYSQMVKRTCFAETFDFYANAYRPKFKSSLSVMLTLLGKSNVIVKVYEECKSDIFNDFLKTLSNKNFDFKSLEQINRSLTMLEVSLLRQVNKIDDKKALSRTLSDYLIYNHKVKKEPFTVSQEQLDLISKNNKEDLDWLNYEFFGGTPRLKYISEKVVIKKHVESENVEGLLELCAILLCRK